MSIQIYWKFYHQKNENFQIKNSYIFHISAQNIDCGYSLELPRRGGSNEHPQFIENRLDEAVLTSTHNLCFEQDEAVLTSTHNLCFEQK